MGTFLGSFRKSKTRAGTFHRHGDIRHACARAAVQDRRTNQLMLLPFARPSSWQRQDPIQKWPSPQSR
jgi:hypothetical protein